MGFGISVFLHILSAVRVHMNTKAGGGSSHLEDTL